MVCSVLHTRLEVANACCGCAMTRTHLHHQCLSLRLNSISQSSRRALSDQICSADQVRDLTDQIRRVRDNKINQGLELVTGPLTAKLNNLCCMELNTLRPFFLGSLDRFWRMSQVAARVVSA